MAHSFENVHHILAKKENNEMCKFLCGLLFFCNVYNENQYWLTDSVPEKSNTVSILYFYISIHDSICEILLEKLSTNWCSTEICSVHRKLS